MLSKNQSKIKTVETISSLDNKAQKKLLQEEAKIIRKTFLKKNKTKLYKSKKSCYPQKIIEYKDNEKKHGLL